MPGESNQVKWVGIRPTNPAESIPIIIGSSPGILPTQEQAPITTIKILEAATQQVFQHEPGPWAATRGGVTRTQIHKDGYSTNAYATIYTVTAGKTLYLTSAFMSIVDTSIRYGILAVSNATQTDQYRILHGNCGANTPFTASIAFNMPLAIPAGYLIRIYTAGGEVDGAITGWEE